MNARPSPPVDVLAIMADYWRRHDIPEDLCLAQAATEALIQEAKKCVAGVGSIAALEAAIANATGGAA